MNSLNNRAGFILGFTLLSATIACATFRDPGDPVPTDIPTLAPTSNQTETFTPSPTNTAIPTDVTSTFTPTPTKELPFG